MSFINIEKQYSSIDERQVLLAASILAAILSALHFFTFKQQIFYLEFSHALLTKLYFLPVLLTALFLGSRGAIKLSLVVSVLYLPHSISTTLFSKVNIIENLSEIVLIWITGIIAGTLVDKLRVVQEETIRLASLEKVSGVLSIINSQMMNDYVACTGLTQALEHGYSGSDGNSFTAKLLSERLGHLGAHLTHLHNLAKPTPLNKKKYNVVHLINKCAKEVAGNHSTIRIRNSTTGKVPSLSIDAKKMEFAITQIIRILLGKNRNNKELSFQATRNGETVQIYFNFVSGSDSNEKDTLELFDLLIDDGYGYSLTLALEIINSHGGNVKLMNLGKGAKSICLAFRLE